LGERGFTLVELLAACAILVALAAIAVPTVANYVSHSCSDAAKAELSDVQAALDSMMADNGLESVTAVTTATNDMTNFPSAMNPLSGYLRQPTTKGTFTCTPDVLLTQVTTGCEQGGGGGCQPARQPESGFGFRQSPQSCDWAKIRRIEQLFSDATPSAGYRSYDNGAL
jgi:prepilin-type N-terminal cleavage/methylation domain-containing protein